MLTRRALLASTAVVAIAPFLPALAAPHGLIQRRVYRDEAGNLVIGEPEAYVSMEDDWRASHPDVDWPPMRWSRGEWPDRAE